MSTDQLIAALAAAQAVGVFALVGKAWSWMMRVETRLVRLEAKLSGFMPHDGDKR